MLSLNWSDLIVLYTLVSSCYVRFGFGVIVYFVLLFIWVFWLNLIVCIYVVISFIWFVLLIFDLAIVLMKLLAWLIAVFDCLGLCVYYLGCSLFGLGFYVGWYVGVCDLVFILDWVEFGVCLIWLFTWVWFGNYCLWGWYKTRFCCICLRWGFYLVGLFDCWVVDCFLLIGVDDFISWWFVGLIELFVWIFTWLLICVWCVCISWGGWMFILVDLICGLHKCLVCLCLFVGLIAWVWLN